MWQIKSLDWRCLMSDEGDFVTVEVSSWLTLMEVLEIADVTPQWKDQGGHWRSPYVFRGLNCEAYQLDTTLERLASPPERVEGPLLRSFSKYLPPGTHAVHSAWERLALAQHNGLPTRLLDWTTSPLVALHFATASKEHYDKNAVVWCVDVEQVHSRPTGLAGKLRDAGAFLYFAALLDELFPTLNKLDSYAEPNFKESFMLFFEPPSIDARIQNQRGVLSVANGPAQNQHAYLRELARRNPKSVRRIVIASEAKPKIRDMLDQSNITERVLFPGLPGLCQWLGRYYGPQFAC
jgi:hypothetical protein